jgi:hypothetical protein
LWRFRVKEPFTGGRRNVGSQTLYDDALLFPVPLIAQASVPLPLTPGPALFVSCRISDPQGNPLEGVEVDAATFCAHRGGIRTGQPT